MTVEVGVKYNYLTVLHEVERRKGKLYFECQCECGQINVVAASNLKTSQVKSCGKCKLRGSGHVKHGLTGDPLANVYYAMISRCYNPDNESYSNYGGRGILVCGKWRNSSGLANFISWARMNGYRQGLDLDRRDNNYGYAPSNCRFVPRQRNLNNRRVTIMIEYQGRQWPLSDLHRHLKSTVNTGTVRTRYLAGWDVIRAMLEPPRTTRT